ncbi:hypothetical protein GCM10025787_49970 [Saccharopolyspora rosea]
MPLVVAQSGLGAGQRAESFLGEFPQGVFVHAPIPTGHAREISSGGTLTACADADTSGAVGVAARTSLGG